MSVKRIMSLILTFILVMTTAFVLSISQITVNAATKSKIDNSDLMPKYKPDSEVTLDENGTPDWLATSIIMQLRITHATEEGTLESAIKVLDHCRELGVNVIHLCPINEFGEKNKSSNQYGNTYTNLGPHTLDSRITGTTNVEEGWKKVKWFIDEAHKRDVRVLFDMITWGTYKDCELKQQHPDWYDGQDWGGDTFDWTNEEFKEWYINQLVDIGVKTGCDGFRMDCEPRYAGYDVNKAIVERLRAKGRKILMISEDTNIRNGAFHLEQNGATEYGVSMTDIYNNAPGNRVFFTNNIVDSVKSGTNIGATEFQDTGFGGTLKYYTMGLSCHDSKVDTIAGNRNAIGYQAIFAPFIPYWYLSQEWNDGYSGMFYVHRPDWDRRYEGEHGKFFEDVKQMIRIRRQNPDIFEYWPENHQETNICAINVAGNENLQSYARFSDNKAFMIIPNDNVHDKSGNMTVYVPFEDMNLTYYKYYTVTNAITGKVIVKGSMSEIRKFDINVPKDDMAIIKIEATGKYNPPSKDDIIDDVDDTVINDVIDDAEDITESKKDKPKKHKKVVTYISYFPIWAIVLIVVGVLALAGGITAIILIKRKKKKVTE